MKIENDFSYETGLYRMPSLSVYLYASPSHVHTYTSRLMFPLFSIEVYVYGRHCHFFHFFVSLEVLVQSKKKKETVFERVIIQQAAL